MRKLQVGENLRQMDIIQCFDRLHLDDQLTVNDQINPIPTVELDFLIDERERPVCRQSLLDRLGRKLGDGFGRSQGSLML